MPIASMSRRRASAFDAPAVAGCRAPASRSPTLSQVIPGRQIACRGILEFIVSRKTLPYEPSLPSSRHSADFPGVRNSGSRYLLHSSAVSTTCESLSKTGNRLVATLTPHRCLRTERALHFLLGRPPFRAFDFGDPIGDEGFGRIDPVHFARVTAEELRLIRLGQFAFAHRVDRAPCVVA